MIGSHFRCSLLQLVRSCVAMDMNNFTICVMWFSARCWLLSFSCSHPFYSSPSIVLLQLKRLPQLQWYAALLQLLLPNVVITMDLQPVIEPFFQGCNMHFLVSGILSSSVYNVHIALQNYRHVQKCCIKWFHLVKCHLASG